MSWDRFREEYGEGPEDHFDDPYEYARYLERTRQKGEANQIRRMMEKEEGKLEERHREEEE